MWAVFDGKRRLIEFTLKRTRRESIAEWCKRWVARCQWPYWKKQGYTCRPVRVTIEEIKMRSDEDKTIKATTKKS